MSSWLKDDPSQRYDFLKDLTAVDYGHGMFLQVVYELWSMENRRQLRLKVELPMDGLRSETSYFLWRAADWMEREVYDMFGIVFRGHPDLRRILMPYNYAEGHPLRKDFPLRGRFSRAEQTRRALSMKTEDHYSPYELELARRLNQPLPDVMAEGGPGVPNQGIMPGIGGGEGRPDDEKSRLQRQPLPGAGRGREPGPRADRAGGGRGPRPAWTGTSPASTC
jgi:NADH-quinone oxidoreductase subunit C